MIRFFLYIFIAAPLFGQTTVDINEPNFDGKSFGVSTYWHKGDYSIETIRSADFQKNFIKGDRPILTFGYDDSPYWYRITFFNDTNQNQAIFLLDGHNIINEFRVYDNNLQLANFTSKDTLPKRVLKVIIPSSSRKTLFIKMQTDYPQQLTWTFWKNKDLLTE